jgi:hypothetical protein
LALLVGTRLDINGSNITAATILPLVSVSSYYADIIITATANTTVSVEFFGVAATAILLSGSAGATINIIRIS